MLTITVEIKADTLAAAITALANAMNAKLPPPLRQLLIR